MPTKKPEHEQRPQRLPQNLFPLHPFRAFVHNVTRRTFRTLARAEAYFATLDGTEV